MKPLISVIIPIYNVEEYLVRCVNSVLNQTYQNLEIILVDDGSPDNSPRMCDEFAKKDSRIKVIHKKNGGLSSARNAGLDIATGEYVAFLDSDDYIHPQMYEKLLTSLQANTADMVICGVHYVNEDGTDFDKVEPCPIKNEVLTQDEVFAKLSKPAGFYYVTTWNKLYKKSIFNNIRFPEGKIHEDEFTIHYIVAECEKIACVKEELYHYVQRSESIMHTTFSIKRLDGAWACYDRYLFFKKRGQKEFAHNALRGAYGVLLLCIRNVSVLQYRKTYKKLRRKIIVGLRTDLRVVKLLLIYYKRLFREVAGNIKRKCIQIPALKHSFNKARKNNEKVAVIIATPVHGNLGDQAIVMAEKQMLASLGYGKNKVVEVPNPIYLKERTFLQKFIKNSDWIIIDGGGNLGSLWPWEDDKISQIISDYPNNKITIFPQTIYYGNTKADQVRLEKNRAIYEQHKQLNIFFRDYQSYSYFINNFPKTKAFYSPDVVLYMQRMKSKAERKGALLCLRKDIEKVLEDKDIQEMRKFLASKGINYSYTTTVIDKKVTARTRERELMKKWNEFSSAQIVITDRLHGMIFAAITGTPCVALDNKSKKVSGVYSWLRDLPYIRCVNTIEELKVEYENIIGNNDRCIHLNTAFDQMKKDLFNG